MFLLSRANQRGLASVAGCLSVISSHRCWGQSMISGCPERSALSRIFSQVAWQTGQLSRVPLSEPSGFRIATNTIPSVSIMENSWPPGHWWAKNLLTCKWATLSLFTILPPLSRFWRGLASVAQRRTSFARKFIWILTLWPEPLPMRPILPDRTRSWQGGFFRQSSTLWRRRSTASFWRSAFGLHAREKKLSGTQPWSLGFAFNYLRGEFG